MFFPVKWFLVWIHKVLYLKVDTHKATTTGVPPPTTGEGGVTTVVKESPNKQHLETVRTQDMSVYSQSPLGLELEFGRIHLCIIFFILIASSYITQSIGIHAFFGAYVAGIIIPKEGKFVDKLAPKLELVVVDFLLPLYFANNVLSLRIQSISTGQDVGVMFAIIFIASFAKMVPSLFATKLSTGQSWRFCGTMAVLMNTRGLVELIVLNVGLSLGILSSKVFVMMVVMAVVTTALTPPLIYLLVKTGHGLPVVTLSGVNGGTCSVSSPVTLKLVDVTQMDGGGVGGDVLDDVHEHTVRSSASVKTVTSTGEIPMVPLGADYLYSTTMNRANSNPITLYKKKDYDHYE